MEDFLRPEFLFCFEVRNVFPEKKKFKIPVDTSTVTNSVENRAILTKYRLQVSVANKCSISSRVCQTFICHKS